MGRGVIGLDTDYTLAHQMKGDRMVTKALTDIRRMDATLEYRNMSDLLKGFREYLEREAGTPVERLDANAALVLHDLCEFLRLGEPQRQKVLGRSAVAFVNAELATRVKLPIIR
jgi:hypothetical protein